MYRFDKLRVSALSRAFSAHMSRHTLCCVVLFRALIDYWLNLSGRFGVCRTSVRVGIHRFRLATGVNCFVVYSGYAIRLHSTLFFRFYTVQVEKCKTVAILPF